MSSQPPVFLVHYSNYKICDFVSQGLTLCVQNGETQLYSWCLKLQSLILAAITQEFNCKTDRTAEITFFQCFLFVLRTDCVFCEMVFFFSDLCLRGHFFYCCGRRFLE